MNKTGSLPRVVAGYGRSGTTWVLDVLAQANRLRTIFEPLHPNAIPAAAPHAHQYLAVDDEDESLRQLFETFFHGNVHSIWADYRIRTGWLNPRLENLKSWRDFKAAASRFSRGKTYYQRYRGQRRRPERITKVIRANMMISWLRRNFDARIVFMMRHPAAVVLSQSSSPRSWNPEVQLALYRQHTDLVARLGPGAQDLLSASLEHTAALTLAWCIENSIASAQCEESGVPVVYYERLLEYGLPEWQRVLDALGLDALPDEELVAKPSQQAWGEHSRNPALVKRYQAWMKRIDPATAGQIQAVLDACGVTMYRVDEPMPIVAANFTATGKS